MDKEAELIWEAYAENQEDGLDSTYNIDDPNQDPVSLAMANPKSFGLDIHNVDDYDFDENPINRQEGYLYVLDDAKSEFGFSSLRVSGEDLEDLKYAFEREAPENVTESF